MITNAIDVITKENVTISKAHHGRRYSCPFCGVDMHPVLEVQTQHYSCFPGGRHSNPLCEQLVDKNRAYDPKLTDVTKLFDHLFRPVIERMPPPVPPVDGDDPDQKPEPGDPETEPGNDPDDGELDDDDKIPEPSEPVVLPCRTLSQLWKAKIHKLWPFEIIGSYFRSDVFLSHRDFERFLTRRDSIGKRIVEVRPLWVVDKRNAVVFEIFTRVAKTAYYKKKYFVLGCNNRHDYNRVCRRVFLRVRNDSGSEKTVPGYRMVLLAGDWRELSEAECATYSITNRENIYGAQISHYYSKNQLYTIPEEKIKY